jgi:hypothetical protein
MVTPGKALTNLCVHVGPFLFAKQPWTSLPLRAIGPRRGKMCAEVVLKTALARHRPFAGDRLRTIIRKLRNIVKGARCRHSRPNGYAAARKFHSLALPSRLLACAGRATISDESPQ